ncbi:MAG: DUF362 domain-containing protein [Actinobacteria bacterium]|nr:DUF362 domain-containing protein [Actinomycetota bacterium]
MDSRSTSVQTGFVAQSLTLFEAAGYNELIRPNDVVAVKVHCGEWNNTAYLRPVFARAICDHIKSLGGKPFVCDTTTLSYGPYAARCTAPDLLRVAERNGFTSGTLGCPFIAADGYNGTDDVRVELPEGYILKEAYVAKAIALADVMIALTHFKGHPLGVIGGSIKNLGIGAQSKRGKYNVHMGGHPTYSLPATVIEHVEHVNADVLEAIPDICPYGALERVNGAYAWHKERCTSCLGCLGLMIGNGVWEVPAANFMAAQAAMADATLAVVKALDGRVGFINHALDISPKCDCGDHADKPLVPHVGIFAGRDPVALDQACLDAVTAAHGSPGSAAEDWDVLQPGARKFAHASSLAPGISEEIQINTAVKIGLGSKDYELVTVEPKPSAAAFAYSLDQRMIGPKYRDLFTRENPFPAERHHGHGFARAAHVDLEAVK